MRRYFLDKSQFNLKHNYLINSFAHFYTIPCVFRFFSVNQFQLIPLGIHKTVSEMQNRTKVFVPPITTKISVRPCWKLMERNKSKWQSSSQRVLLSLKNLIKLGLNVFHFNIFTIKVENLYLFFVRKINKIIWKLNFHKNY